MDKLTRKDEALEGERPKRINPVSIEPLRTFLRKTIHSYGKYRTPYNLRSNISYSLGFLEFQFRCLQDFELNTALEKQIYKSIIVTGMGIMEGILGYLLITKGLHKKITMKKGKEDLIKKEENEKEIKKP